MGQKYNVNLMFCIVIFIRKSHLSNYLRVTSDKIIVNFIFSSQENAAYNSGGEDLRECEAMRKIFVGGLNRNSKDEDFSEVFAQFGTILDSVIIKDPHTKGSRGFGFVTYDTSEAVEKCFQGRPHMLDGKALDTKRAIPREYNTSSAHARTKKLFIGGISYEMSPDDIQQYIESRHPRDYGFIEKVDILKDRETGKNKSFGFLYCSTEDFADRLIISEPQFQLNGRNMSIKKAEPKNEGNPSFFSLSFVSHTCQSFFS